MQITYFDEKQENDIEFEFNAEIKMINGDLEVVVTEIPEENKNMILDAKMFAERNCWYQMESDFADDKAWTRQGMEYFHHN